MSYLINKYIYIIYVFKNTNVISYDYILIIVFYYLRFLTFCNNNWMKA